MSKYSHSILGGTFDHFHAGHKFFLKKALEKSERLTIGLTIDSFSRHKPLHHSIESYDVREKNVLEFLSENNYLDKATIIPIKDAFGTSLTDDTIEAIFVTRHGLTNAKLINTKRAELDKSELLIESVPFLLDSRDEIISSTRIRAGEIDRSGNAYIEILTEQGKLILTDNLRADVKILGEVKGGLEPQLDSLEDIQRGKEIMTIAVGDVVSKNLIDMGRQAEVSVVDFKSGRELYLSTPLSSSLPKGERKLGKGEGELFQTELQAINEAGTINSKAARAIENAIKNNLKTHTPYVVEIDGEEDLLAIPAILLAPLNSIIVYGLPGVGVVEVKVTEEKKREIRELAEKFL